MDSALERALADEVLAEVARQRITATEMQRRTGIKSRTWANYFVNQSSRIPITAVNAVAETLGLRGSELMARAEQRAAQAGTHDAQAERALSQMTPEGQALARRLAREIRDQPEEEDERTTAGVVRSASY